jgi:formyltetrahydrofolate synthetase
MGLPSDIEIANRAALRSIREVVERLGITDDELIPYGRYKAKVHIAAGAGFLVPITGEIMTMPGLPKHPAAEQIDVDDQGRILGLF